MRGAWLFMFRTGRGLEKAPLSRKYRRAAARLVPPSATRRNRITQHPVQACEVVDAVCYVLRQELSQKWPERDGGRSAPSALSYGKPRRR